MLYGPGELYVREAVVSLKHILKPTSLEQNKWHPVAEKLSKWKLFPISTGWKSLVQIDFAPWFSLKSFHNEVLKISIIKLHSY